MYDRFLGWILFFSQLSRQARNDRKEAASRLLDLSRLASVPAKREKPGITIGNFTSVLSRSSWYTLSRISCSPLNEVRGYAFHQMCFR